MRAHKTTRACTLVILIPLLVTACGTTDPGQAGHSGTQQSSTAGRTATSADCASDRTRTATGPVALKDALGRTISLKAPAQRVVSLDWDQTENLLTLCAPPVAVADTEAYRTWATAERLPQGVKDVGSRPEPSIETILAAKPDLVVVSASLTDDTKTSSLKKYGIPVLTTRGADAKSPISTMLASLDLVARATGRQDRARVVKAQFQRSTSTARQQISTKLPPAGRRFVYFDGWIEGGNVALRPFGQGSLVGELGESIGLKNAWAGKVDPAYGLGQTDVEGLRTIGDATLLRTGTQHKDGDLDAALAKNPVWKSVPAVKSGRSRVFPHGIWTFGGVRSSQQLIAAFVAQMG